MTWTEPGEARTLVTRYPLVTALAISLAVHTAFFGFWKLGKQLHWWDHQATWLMKLHKKKRPTFRFAKVQPATQPKPRLIPLTFVEVDPATAAKEAPKDAKYYSAQNSKAANPDATLERPEPKVDGQQDKMVRLENVPKPGPQPLQPAIAPEKTTEEAKPKPTDTIGDLAKIKPSEVKKPNNGVAEIASDAPSPPERPRTLQEARARRQMLTGEKMRQDGGVLRHGTVSLDAIATPFGSYDAALIAAVQQRWYDLLDTHQFAQRSGKVVLEFHLLYDGRITEMKMMDNEVGEVLGLICQRAIKDPAPYGKWPDDMRRMVEKPYREVKFTFYYY
jgi:hypothetical protein